MSLTAKDERCLLDLAAEAATYADDPIGWGLWAIPWGTPGFRACKFTHPVRERYPDAPDYFMDDWFVDLLLQMEQLIIERWFDAENPAPVDPIKIAVRSGHGIGKGAGCGYIVSFLLDTRPDCKGIITAGTGAQLATKTWPEVTRWRRGTLTAPLWDIKEAFIRSSLPQHNTARVDAMTWDKRNPEAFQGLHAQTSSPFIIKDEASSIHQSIWEASDFGLTDGEPFSLNFGNMTRNTGEFYNCFHKNRNRYDILLSIDSRDVQVTNKKLIEEEIETYGLDHDRIRVRVLGKEPRAGEDQLIGPELVRRAMAAPLPTPDDLMPYVLGVDVARSELGDESVIAVRRGRDARSWPWRYIQTRDTQVVVGAVCEVFDQIEAQGSRPVKIFVDGGGVGGPIHDQLVAAGYPSVEVHFGSKSVSRPDRFLRKDAEMWVNMKEWMEEGGCIPEDELLETQLCNRPYTYTVHHQYALMDKDRVKEELGVESPDRADALGLTFAYPVGRLRSRTDSHQPQTCIM